ncbi:uncharacterized protein LOC129761449 [Toxorhynchites rutilus septentrionalis]|uniref:uncharacterized protein LOC129761449 n=1 Tax=Toxorhynchites rutilus septentrionalis TaxID=329112 RepID=UPI0024785309|nr:uncharacterized protein LOC129761449 [Toxorhynchites rutilus septentrionalis]
MIFGKLLYADDLKIFRVIKSILDCTALQTDLNITSQWCSDNGMQINITKCKVITFNRGMSPINHVYSINTTPPECVQSIRDLGVVSDSKLTITVKAFSVLGFIRRNASQFTDIYALKALFCTLVRSTLEYASPIWSPHHVAQVIHIERV